MARNRVSALRAASLVLAREGRDAVTQARVAAASGVSRATVYRLWPDRTDLLLDILFHLAETAHTVPRGGSAAADLEAELGALARRFSGPLRPVVAMLVEQAQHDDRMATALDRLRRDGTRVLQELLADASTAGRLRAGVTPELALEVLVGGVVGRLLVSRRPVSRSYVASLVGLVLDR